MHYYQFNIGDYAKSTRHLTLMQDLAYRRLLDMYYDTSKPLSTDVKKLSRLIGMPENQADVEVVLSDFFDLYDIGYSQKRVDEELAAYIQKAEKARANGKKGGRPPKADRNPEETPLVNLANPVVTVLQTKHKPLTINQVKDSVGKIQPHVMQSAFEHTWKIWSQVKKTLGVKDNSSKKDAKEKGWAKLFNPTYCKTNNEDYFRAEINAIIKEIKKAHQPSEFNSYANMHFIRFLNQESWRSENA